MNKKYVFPLIVLIILIIIFIPVLNYYNKEFKPKKINFNLIEKSKILNTNLPIGDISYYEVNRPKGVVFLIPQIHINPETKASDKLNDKAENVQKQIYEILLFLHDSHRADFIMVEGELFEIINNEKVKKLKNIISEKNTLVNYISVIDREKRINEDYELIKKRVLSLNREIALRGAPQRLKAEKNELILYGSENKDTYKETIKIVKNYINQKEELREFNVGLYNNSIAFESTNNYYKSNSELYKKRTACLNKKMKETEKNIANIVIKRRNLETAENFDLIAQQNNYWSGILQFGIGHEKELTKELNKRGYSAVVIKVKELLIDTLAKN